MRNRSILTMALALFSALFLAGCPWSNSPNVFEAAKEVSLPNFGGPPPQTEPPLENPGEVPAD